MSALIKSGAIGDRMRAMPDRAPDAAARRPAQRPPQDPDKARLHDEIVRLEAQVSAQTAVIESLTADAARARVDAEQRGHDAGLAEGRAISAEMLALLKTAVEHAVGHTRDQLSALERLAPQIARVALDRVLGPGAPQAALVEQSLRRQMRLLEQEAVLLVEVSSDDFATPSDLERLGKAIGNPRVDIRAVAHLPAGGCRMQFQLGGIDVGPAQQWEALGALLGDLAHAPAGGSGARRP